MNLDQSIIALNELFPHLKCTIQMLKKPTTEFVADFCKAVVQLIYVENIWKANPEQQKSCSESLMSLRLIELQNLCKVFQYICEKIRVRGNFNIIDLKKPDERRIQYYVRHVVNYFLFHQLYQDDVVTPCLPIIEEVRNDKRMLVKKCTQADLIISEKNANIRNLKEKVIESKNTELTSQYNALVLVQESLVKDIKELNQKLKNINSSTEGKLDNVQDLENDIKKLEEEICDDFEIYEKKHKKLVATKKERDRKIAELEKNFNAQNKNIQLHLELQNIYMQLLETIGRVEEIIGTEKLSLDELKSIENNVQDIQKDYHFREKNINESITDYNTQKKHYISMLRAVDENNSQVKKEIIKLETGRIERKELRVTAENSFSRLFKSKETEINNRLKKSYLIKEDFQKKNENIKNIKMEIKMW